MSIIKISNITCGYGTKIVLSKLSLDIEKAEFTGIIGPNGSGKTTLLKSITRLIKPHSGKIFIEDKELFSIDYKELARKIAVVSQNLPVMSMTVREYVLLGRTPHYRNLQLFESENDIEITEHAMAMTGIIKLQDCHMSEISGGEIQLALIARALAQEPWILLLDEPTAHLDISHQVKILDLIKRLNREYGLTVIIVLHDLNLASEYCDRLVFMDKGTIRKTGKPQEVLNYEDIEEAYNTVVIVEKNPVSLKPFVIAVSEEVKNNCRR